MQNETQGEKQKAVGAARAEAQLTIRNFRWMLATLAACVVASVVSLATGVIWVSTDTNAQGTSTSVLHHTFASRVVASLFTACLIFLIIGIFRRWCIAWRAAFAFPLLITVVAGVIAWPQLSSSGSIEDTAIPLAILAAIGIWNTWIWRRQWLGYKSFFSAG